jgi:hypothetical protein
LTNQGVISANVSGQTLEVSPSSLVNTGTLSALNGGILDVGLGFTNKGTLAVDARSAIDIARLLVQASGSAFNVELGNSGQCGILSVTGDLALQNNVALNLNLAPGAVFSGPYEVASYTGALSGAFSQVTPGFVVDYSQPGEILVSTIPEPAAFGGLAAFAGLALARRRRRLE